MFKFDTSKSFQTIAILMASTVWMTVGNPLLAQDDPPGVYKAPSAEPTPAETLLLEYVNRSRANPAQDAALIVKSKKIPKNVNVKQFEDEMRQFSAAPPVVFDLSLTKAARWHSAYQIQHGQGHSERPGSPGFSGAGPGDRARAAGYRSSGIAENVFLQSRDPWYCHCGFVVDWGDGPGGMQPKRGHRKNILNPSWSLAGFGAIPHSQSKLSVTQNFGRSRQRMAGGVVYEDKNQNRFYDIGEGVGGISLGVDAMEVKSWASGAYSLPISSGEQKIKIQIGKAAFVGMLPTGNDNVKFDVFLLDVAATRSQAATILKNVKKIPEDERNQERRKAALTNLYLATQDSLIEESIFDEVATLTAGVQQELEAAMEGVRQTISGDDLKEAKKRISDYANTYRRTAAKAWFADAKSCLSIVEAYQRLKRRKESGKSLTIETAEKTLKSQQRVFQKLSVPEWQTYGLEMGNQIRELAQDQ